MKIFLGHLPRDISQRALREHVEGAINGPWYSLFPQTGVIKNLEVLNMMDIETKKVERHAVVEIYPQKIAWRVLKRMKGGGLEGKPIEVHRWIDRNGVADRRAREDDHKIERRARYDRRRQLLIDSPPIQIHGVDAMRSGLGVA